MHESEATIVLLREIRDEIRSNTVELKSEVGELRNDLKSEIGELRSEFGGLRLEIGELKTELKSEIEITNTRLAAVEQTVTDAAAQIVFLGRYLKNRTVADIDDLKLRVSKLEAKLPD